MTTLETALARYVATALLAPFLFLPSPGAASAPLVMANGTQCQVGNASCTIPPQPVGSICYCGSVAGTTAG